MRAAAIRDQSGSFFGMSLFIICLEKYFVRAGFRRLHIELSKNGDNRIVGKHCFIAALPHLGHRMNLCFLNRRERLHEAFCLGGAAR